MNEGSIYPSVLWLAFIMAAWPKTGITLMKAPENDSSIGRAAITKANHNTAG